MSERHTFVAGDGPLTYRRVLHEAWGMFRVHYLRVAVVAAIVFVPPPLLTAVLDVVRELLESDPRLVGGLGYLMGLLVATALRLLGPVVFAGYLDEAVGEEYFRREFISFGQVLRRLPWLRLVAADLIIVLGTTIGLSLFVVPGIVFLTLFTLVGPVIVQERHGVVDGFRRTYQISRSAWRMVLVLVVALLAVEHAIHEVVHDAVHEAGPLVQALAAWIISAVIGGIVGLIEVALATELMARTPIEPRHTLPREPSPS